MGNGFISLQRIIRVLNGLKMICVQGGQNNVYVL